MRQRGSLPSTRVLVVDDGDLWKGASAVLGEAVADIARASAGSTPALADCHLLLIDTDALDAAAAAQVADDVVRAGATHKTILVASSPGAALQPFFERAAASHLVPPPDASEEAAAALRRTAATIVADAPFPTRELVAEDAGVGGGVMHVSLTSAREKKEVLMRAERAARDAAAGERLLQRYVTVVEELLTNALFNAPTDESGRRCFAHLPRDGDVTLAPQQAIAVRLHVGPERLGVSVTDPFGSLPPATVLRYLAGGLGDGGGIRVESKEGGAGIGLYTVFMNSQQFIVRIAPGACTEALAVLDAGRGARDPGKVFGVFVEGAIEGGDERADDDGAVTRGRRAAR